MDSLAEMTFDHLVGRQVGTAVLLKELARGGMATVFIAYQKTLKRQIAVKILPRCALTPSSAELFQQEAESAAILSHPNIVPIYEVGETEEFLFFTMQLIRGVPLSQLIKRVAQHVLPSRRFFSPKAAVKIVLAVLDALAYAHREGVIHRDIKPANILIEAHTHRPLITDFGIAKVMRAPTVNAPMVYGTPIYMAPEQITGGEVSARADVYSAGVVLFELLTTVLPIPPYDRIEQILEMKMILKDRLFQKKPSEINPAVDGLLDEVVSKAVAFDAAMRYASCTEFAAALEGCSSTLS